MKPRILVLAVGVGAIVGVGGSVAYQNPWVRSLFARSVENAAEVDRGKRAQLANAAPADAATGFPQWRGASRKGVAPAGPFRIDWDKNPPKELWRESGGGGYGSCAVVGGKLYVQDRLVDKERVVCRDAETGKQLWEFAYDAPQAGADRTSAIGPRATPTVVGDTMFTVGGAGKLLALTIAGDKPERVWEHDLLAEFEAPLPQWGVACSPLVLGDLVIVQPGGKNASVVAFDKVTGEVKWKAGSHGPGYSSPVAARVGGQDTVFAFMADALLAVRASDGAVTDRFKWATQFSGNIATPIVVDDEYVFVSSTYGMGCALLRAEKSGDDVKLVKVYERRGRAFQSHHATAVYKDKHLFGTDGTRGDRGLKCIEFITGKEVLDWEAPELGQASVLLAGEHLIVQTEKGDVCLVDANPKEFNLVGRVRKVLSGNNNWATPTLVNGRLYLRDEKSVVGLDVRP